MGIYLLEGCFCILNIGNMSVVLKSFYLGVDVLVVSKT